MDGIDPRLHAYLVGQGLLRSPERRGATAATAPTGPEDRFSPEEAADLGLLPRHSRPSPGPEFQLESSDESIRRLVKLRRQGLAEDLREVRRKLRAREKELDRRGAPLEERARVWSGLREVAEAARRLEAAHRGLRWEGIERAAGGGFSPTYRSYYIHGDTPAREMVEVLRTARSLENPDSPLRLKGNRVEPLTRGEIWQAKMDLLEEAAARPVRNGRPVPVDVEYYELASPQMLEKIGRAARGGAKVRVLLDPGRLRRTDEGFDATALASRLNALRRLDEASRGKAAVQLFATKQLLGGRDELMHRKLLRVGDEVIFGGMNANPGSSENVDFSMRVRGPGAARLAEAFQEDVERSRGRSLEEIYGDQIALLRKRDDITVAPRGLRELLEAQLPGGPRPGESPSQRVDRMLESASYAGLQASELAAIPDMDGDGRVTRHDERAWLLEGRNPVRLTRRGREVLAAGLERAVEQMNSPDNQEKLRRGSLPSAAEAGSDTVAVGNTPVERQALVLHAIDSAERFIKVSAFVVTEDVARLLVEKKKRMEAQGRPFQVQVVLDPGLYDYGGTPNEAAFKLLEDGGVEVRWAVLPGTDPGHDRKVHAKLMLTDKMMLAGSTNFSNKGLRDNQELSDVTYFTDDPRSRAFQQKVEADFQRLWEEESLSIDTRALARARYGEVEGAEGEMLRASYRNRILRAFLQEIDRYEQEMASGLQALQARDPFLADAVERRVSAGASRGYALLAEVGGERLAELRATSPAWQRLQELREGSREP